MKSKNGGWYRYTEVPPVPGQEPCVTNQVMIEANKELAGIIGIDYDLLPTAMDVFIVMLTLVDRYLRVIPETGTVINSITGKEWPKQVSSYNPEHRDAKNTRYEFISIRIGGRSIKLPVHRLVFFSRPENMQYLGQEFELHHCDGNPLNNSITNLRPFLTRDHCLLHKYANSISAARSLSRAVKEAKGNTVFNEYMVKSLRVCAGQFPRNSRRRSNIYRYFAEQTGSTQEYMYQIVSRQRQVTVQEAAPKEAEQILQDFKWLVNGVQTGKTYDRIMHERALTLALEKYDGEHHGEENEELQQSL